jgi:hypothetical protein
MTVPAGELPPPGPGARVRIWPFFAWAVVGAGGCLALAAVFTIGIFVEPAVIAVAAGLLAWGGSRTIAAVGLLSGLGLVPLYIAFLNRGGPGDVCSYSAGGQSCTTEWSPWPWLIAGVLLVAGGAALFAWLRPGTGRPAAAPPVTRPPG